MSINGNGYDWESIEIRMAHGVVIDVEDISYSDEAPIEEHYGKGRAPIGYGRGNYKASGNLTLGMDEFEKLKSNMGGSVYKGKPGQIVVGYANDDMPTVTDTLPDIKFTKTDTSAKQGDTKAGNRKLDIKILSPIKWGDSDALDG